VLSDKPYADVPAWDAAGRVPPDASPTAPAARLICVKDNVRVGESTRIVLKDGNQPVRSDSPYVIWQGAVPPVVTPAPASQMPSLATAASPPPPVDTTPIGFVDQRGGFTALRAGVGTVTALYHRRLITVPVTVKPRPSLAPFSTIRVALSRDPGGSQNRAILAIHIVRVDGGPVAGVSVKIEVTHGQADNTSVTTDVDGGATVGITWDSNNGGLVTASSTGLASVTLGQIQ
jgi:hypothetical protein